MMNMRITSLFSLIDICSVCKVIYVLVCSGHRRHWATGAAARTDGIAIPGTSRIPGTILQHETMIMLIIYIHKYFKTAIAANGVFYGKTSERISVHQTSAGWIWVGRHGQHRD